MATHHLRALTRSLHTSPVRTDPPSDLSAPGHRSRRGRAVPRDATFIRSHSVTAPGPSADHKTSVSFVRNEVREAYNTKRGSSNRRASVPMRQDTFITARVVPASELKSSLFSSSSESLTSSKGVSVHANANANRSDGWSDDSVRRKQQPQRSSSVQAATCSITSRLDALMSANFPETQGSNVYNSRGRGKMSGACRESRHRASVSTNRANDESQAFSSKGSGSKAYQGTRARSSHSKSSRRR
ncbi:hypothetical protein WMY93_030999 [Mugilogobius chulae]|uniref:Uncharacterized protein n=1 Tax=Mugilogobius chulae TaxID=88201 RepID=A0AAW0MN02_9GOBI